MVLIGENLNIMSRRIGEALKQRDSQPIQEMAIAQVEAGMDMIDVNLGPARKGGAELMEWVVNIIQEVVDLPLSLDTTNVEAMEAGLRVHRGRALINSISARPERIEALMPLVKRYNVPFVGLLLGMEGIPRDADERALLAVQFMSVAEEYGIPASDIWFDPIVLPINTQQMQVQGCTEFVKMLPDLAPQSRSTCGLSNVSNGVPRELRGIINRTYIIMLKRYGLYSAIVDAFDKELKAIVEGKMEAVEHLIYKAMDGEEIDISKLSKEEIDYVKTAKILLGKTIYSDSWLQV